MGMKTAKRLASKILKRGTHAIRVVPGQEKKVGEALTREDVRGLIKSGALYAKRKKGVSRAKARIRALKRKKGRQRGPGKRKGKKHSRLSEKTKWMSRIRAQRKELRSLLDSNKVNHDTYRRLYAMVKGGAFRAKAQMISYLKDNKLMLDVKE